jgi:hypothetical protein
VFRKVEWVGTTYDGVMARYREVDAAVPVRIVVLDNGSYRFENGRTQQVPVTTAAEPEPKVPWTRLALGALGVLVGAGLLALLKGRGGAG